VAAALARGMTTQEIIDFYVQSGPDMFSKSGLLRRITIGRGG